MTFANPRIREQLASSHIGAVAVVALLFSGCDSVFDAISQPFVEGVSFLVRAVAILDFPTMTVSTPSEILISAYHLYWASLCFVLAWCVSHWTYGVGPIRCLTNHREKFVRKSHA